MSLRRVPNGWEWRRLHERLDKAVAEAANGYVLMLAAQHVKIRIRDLSDELEELRLGREPDYDRPGFPLVYALKYMPRRVVSIYGALLRADLNPYSVLDVGSGTGTTALALDLLNLARHVNLTGIEPSGEMISFSECSRFRDRVSSDYKRGSIADLPKMRLGLERFDLAVFSAALPYAFDDWEPIMTAIGNYQGKESKTVVVIEPDAKQNLLNSFRRRLIARGWPTVTFCCHDLPEVIKNEPLPLREMQSVCQRLGLEAEPKTWWNPPDDRFLIANPRPAEAAPPRIDTSPTLSTQEIRSFSLQGSFSR
jgi:SAM-dependent methyltransferase